uniref:Sodium-coupled monocarboxylate transporter 2 n=1 Tax=Glossina palpalis gambiensis TaxID=67801 RepID=A0A1B0BS69_9MUSC
MVAFNSSDISEFTFNAVDYTVFIVMLSISAAIGVYYGFVQKSENTTAEYLHGGKRMRTLPIAISLVASQLSAVAIMAIPAESYSFGINWAFNVIAMIIIIPIINYIVIPVFYNNNISNCYEYLEMRFNSKTRDLMTLSFVGNLCFILPLYMFIPSLAFAQVTGFNIHFINGIVCSICVFYTMVGGIKAVVWTDVVQGTVMLTSVILVFVLGIIKVGGFSEVFRLATDGQRLDINFTFDATTRSTFWNCFSSAIVVWTSYVGMNQSCVQRIVSLPSLKHAQRSLFLFGIGFAIIMFLNSLTGIVMYARYHDCDPVAAGFVEKADKLMPFFVQDIVGYMKGMPGVFISCVFSAALSTLSASLNSLAGIVYFDYIKPRIKHTESRANFIMKSIVLFTGLYCIAAGVIVEKFSSIIQMLYSITGVTFGAVFGVFLLGMLVPQSHGRAAFCAVAASMLTMLVIVLGAQGGISYEPLPTSTESCVNGSNLMQNFENFTSLLLTDSPPKDSFNILNVSFNWYMVLGASVVFIVGIPLSYILPPGKDAKFDPKFLSPVIQPLLRYELTRTDELPEILIKEIPKS